MKSRLAMAHRQPAGFTPGVIRIQQTRLRLPVTMVALALGWSLGFPQDSSAAEDGTEVEMGGAHGQKFVGTTPGLQVSLEYPEGWSLSEEHGQVERYELVRLLGPRNQDESYSCYLSVQGAPTQAFGGKWQGREDLAQNYLSHLHQGAQVLETRETIIAGIPAKDITVFYTMSPWRHQGLKAVDIPIKARTLILERGPYVYQLIYSADAREYDRYADAFERLLNTLAFQ